MAGSGSFYINQRMSFHSISATAVDTDSLHMGHRQSCSTAADLVSENFLLITAIIIMTAFAAVPFDPITGPGAKSGGPSLRQHRES